MTRKDYKKELQALYEIAKGQEDVALAKTILTEIMSLEKNVAA